MRGGRSERTKPSPRSRVGLCWRRMLSVTRNPTNGLTPKPTKDQRTWATFQENGIERQPPRVRRGNPRADIVGARLAAQRRRASLRNCKSCPSSERQDMCIRSGGAIGLKGPLRVSRRHDMTRRNRDKRDKYYKSKPSYSSPTPPSRLRLWI